MSGKTQKEIAVLNAKVQRETANKPAPLKDMVLDYEKRLGRKLTAEEVEVTSRKWAQLCGYNILGPDRTPEQAAAITKQARETGPVKALEIPLLQAQQSGDPAKIQAANDAYNRALRAAEQDIINQAEAARANKRPDANAPAKSVANVGRTPVPRSYR
jgi:hypothetical protein